MLYFFFFIFSIFKYQCWPYIFEFYRNKYRSKSRFHRHRLELLHFGRSEIVSRTRDYSCASSSVNSFGRLVSNANTLRVGRVLEHERNRLMKTASARATEDCAANGPNGRPALSLDEQRGVSWHALCRTSRKHAPLGGPHLSRAPRFIPRLPRPGYAGPRLFTFRADKDDLVKKKRGVTRGSKPKREGSSRLIFTLLAGSVVLAQPLAFVA